MADAYLAIAEVSESYAMQRRVAACAAQQNAPGDPSAWALDNRLEWAASPGWGAAWDSALVSHPEEGYDPGGDEGVITDGMILAQVQGMLGA